MAETERMAKRMKAEVTSELRCPACGRYNALLADSTIEPGQILYACRDCGVVVERIVPEQEQIDQAVETVASNVRREAPASEWVVNIRMAMDTLHLSERVAPAIARQFGMDWATLLAQYEEAYIADRLNAARHASHKSPQRWAHKCAACFKAKYPNTPLRQDV